MKQINSEMMPSLSKSGSSTGTQPSEPGLATQPNGKPNAQPGAIIARTPQDNLAAAVSSLQACGISVSHEVTGSRFPKNGGWEPVMSLTVRLADQIDADRARSVLGGLSGPAKREQIVEWLTICAIKTAHAKDDDMSSELKLKVFTSELLQFPGDIVRHVLAKWPSKSKWFPTWKELEDEITQLAGIRPQIIQRVQERLNQQGD